MLWKWAVSVVATAVMVGIYLLPSPIEPEPFVFEKTPPTLQGPLAVNRDLQEGRRIFAGQLKGPESFTADADGDLYTGTVDGRLWRIHEDRLYFITQMGRNVSGCGTPDYEPVCGRPHGVRLDREGYLIVADSYLGLYRVHPKTGEKTLLVSNEEGVDGIPFKFLNGLEISRNGTVFFTDSSGKWGRRHHRYEVIETNHLGRLLAYDPATRWVRAVLDGLYMANGIAFSPEEDYLLIAETSVARILRFWLKGPNAGKTEIFIDNMPGYPDNIRLTDRGTFLVGISTTRFPGFSRPFLDLIGPHPALKRFIAKVTPLEFFSVLLRKHGLALELSGAGEVRRSLHDPDGAVTWAVSDAFEHRGRLYLGNTDLPFLAVLDLHS
ncbi:adipocyte plasma membrane-associated protein isoform X2 [Lepisosteus oculatus]|uniref:adipocyte plasma membrane-associated protein isoform X2 n=1 Tax=Lepisosteus oculatus TaxID=7918 RepID=UPI00371C28CC